MGSDVVNLISHSMALVFLGTFVKMSLCPTITDLISSVCDCDKFLSMLMLSTFSVLFTLGKSTGSKSSWSGSILTDHYSFVHLKQSQTNHDRWLHDLAESTFSAN